MNSSFWLNNLDNLPLWCFVLLTIFVLLSLVVVHEAGHFLIARLFNMQTPVVGLGLPFIPNGLSWTLSKRARVCFLAGKKLLLKTNSFSEGKRLLALILKSFTSFPVNFSLFSCRGVEFRFHLLLLGAYVAIPEMDDESGDLDGIKLKQPKRSFPAWQRMLVSFAGPAANLLFALLLAILSVSFLGIPRIIKNQKVIIVNKVLKNADSLTRAQIKVGDRIESLNKININSVSQFLKLRDQINSKKLDLGVCRAQKEQKCQTYTISKNSEDQLGISLFERNATEQVALAELKELPVVKNLKYGSLLFLSWNLGLLSNLAEIIKAPFVKDPRIEAKDVHGIFYAAPKIAEIIKEQREVFFRITGLISIELAIINLLPIMPLDGGHIFFQLGEILVGKRYKSNLLLIRDYLAQAGLLLILALTCFIVLNDFRALILGE